MNADMGEIYHYACMICSNTFSRDEVRAVKDEIGTQFICDSCYSLEINADENKGE